MGQVGIIIVSHSEKLGAGLAELLKQLGGDGVPIASASGVNGQLGTDATKIAEAIEAMPGENEIVIFFDIGSALLSCDMALELVSEINRRRVRIADAPLVEGAIAGVVEASLGKSAAEVLVRAVEARQIEKLDR